MRRAEGDKNEQGSKEWKIGAGDSVYAFSASLSAQWTIGIMGRACQVIAAGS